MSTLLIKNGRVVDPCRGVDEVTNLLVEDGRIAAYGVGENGQDVVIDAADRIVSPGLVDLHVELREPGHEEDETIATGTAAALRGGFTSIACLPNTDPPIDSQASVEFVMHQADRASRCHVYVLACASKDREGKELAEIGSLVKAGAVGFTDADAPIHNAELMRRALQYCQMFDRPVLDHPEVRELNRNGVMHEGMVSMMLGLAGMPTAAEEVMISRDIHLTEATGGRLHLMNISSAGGVELIRRAKHRDVGVTADISALHFSLTDESLRLFDTNYKVNPPLRGREHVEACIGGLADGTIDVISSGHSPRASEKKMLDLLHAPFGVIGLETTLSLVIANLIEPGHLSWLDALAKLTINPARVLGISKGTLDIGADADITIIDPLARWTVDTRHSRSKSSNTPLTHWEMQGRAERVIVGGEVVEN